MSLEAITSALQKRKNNIKIWLNSKDILKYVFGI